MASVAAAARPAVEKESVSGVSTNDATLEAEINPDGFETSYRFHLVYGCGSAGGFCPQYCVSWLPCPGPQNGPVDIPLPSGDLPPTSEVQNVSLDLNEAGVYLTPETEYRFSVEATNEMGRAEGPRQFFTTTSSHPIPSPPAINNESASDITQADATLEAQINPASTERGAIYQFQLSTDTNEFPPEFTCPTEGFPAGSSLCLGLASQEGALPISETAASSQDQSESLDLAIAGVALRPGKTYHYRVIVARSDQSEDTTAWEAPIVYGPDLTFTTLSPAVLGSEPEAQEAAPSGHPEQDVQAPADSTFLAVGSQSLGKLRHCHSKQRHRDSHRRRHGSDPQRGEGASRRTCWDTHQPR